MKPKTMILMVVAVGCGLVASYMTSRLIAERTTQEPAEPRMKVLVAKKKILPMTLLKKPEEYFIEKEMPIDAIPKKAIKGFDELGKEPKRANKLINEEMFVTTDDLVSKELDGLAATLKPGCRAIALKVNPETLVGGFVLPGSHVDVVSTTRDGEATSQIIMQDMLILAVDMQSGRSPDGGTTMLGSTVTIAALPEEATRLALASSLGELRLLLRPMGDEEKLRTRASKRDHLTKPILGSSDTGLTAAEVLAQGNSTPRIPTDLPPVAETPTQNPIEMEQPEPEPVKTHTMVIQQGEGFQRVAFVMKKDGTFEQPGAKSDNEESKNPKTAKPAWPKGAVPEKKGEAPAPVQANPKQKALGEQLQEQSGLPPVKTTK